MIALKKLILAHAPSCKIRYIPTDSMNGAGLVTTSGCANWYRGKSMMNSVVECEQSEDEQPPVPSSHSVRKFVGVLKVSYMFKGIVLPNTFCSVHCGSETTDCTIVKLKRRFL